MPQGFTLKVLEAGEDLRPLGAEFPHYVLGEGHGGNLNTQNICYRLFECGWDRASISRNRPVVEYQPTLVQKGLQEFQTPLK